jgi:enoyl ACP reductase
MLEGRRLLITGVLTQDSIAYAVAERAQAAGAEVVLTGFGRGLRITERIARRLPSEPPVLELDVNDPAHLEAVAADLEERWGALDGVLHAIAFAPEDALGGGFLTAPAESAELAFRTSAFSLKALAAALAPLLERAEPSGAIVGLDFDATVAWPVYDWMGVAKAALESINRYLARDLGSAGVRSNLVSAGPIRTMAARSIPGFGDLADLWEQGAPLGWDPRDPSVVADVCLFLLSPLARAITGEIVHVDGGYHALGAPGASTPPATTAPTEPEPTP